MNFSGTFDLCLQCWLLLTGLATVQICSLELWEDHGGWSLTYNKWGTKRPLCLETPQGPDGHWLHSGFLFVLREGSVNTVKGGTEENRIHIINREHNVNFFLPNTFLLKF